MISFTAFLQVRSLILWEQERVKVTEILFPPNDSGIFIVLEQHISLKVSNGHAYVGST